MRARPCEAPLSWPGPNCSSSTTPTPRRASDHAAAEPMTPPPTTRPSVSRGVATGWASEGWGGVMGRLLSCSAGSGAEARRVGLGAVDGLLLQPPALEHLGVGAVVDRGVDGGGEGLGQAVAAG